MRIVEDKQFLIDVSKLASGITRNVSLHRRHFKKKLNFLTIVKKPKLTNLNKSRVMRIRNKKIPQATKSAALYYALKKRKLLLQNKKITFAESCNILKDLFKEWKLLPTSEKEKFEMEWRKNRRDIRLREKEIINEKEQLQKYNDIKKPAYMDFVTT